MIATACALETIFLSAVINCGRCPILITFLLSAISARHKTSHSPQFHRLTAVFPKNLAVTLVSYRCREYRSASPVSYGTNPMECLSGSGGAISSRIASKTTLNCSSYFCSSASSLSASSE